MVPAIAESGFAFDPAEALRVYDPELIHSEDLRENTVRDLMDMGCIQREDGKLEMPIEHLDEEIFKNTLKNDEEDVYERKINAKLEAELSKLTPSQLIHGESKGILDKCEYFIANYRAERFCKKHAQSLEMQSTLDYEIKDEKIRKLAERGIRCFQQLVPKTITEHLPKIKIEAINGRSKWNDTTLTLKIGDRATILDVIHELAHAVEYHNPFIREETINFLKQRTHGERPVKLKTLTGLNYKEWEKARKDAFWNPYVGKVYERTVVDEHGNPVMDKKGKVKQEVYATEVLSMGLEWIVGSKRGDFLDFDPEHCMLVARLLKLRGEH